MNLKELKELIDIIKGTDISEIEMEKAGTRVRIKKGVDMPQIISRPDTLVSTTASPATVQSDDKRVIITSMIVGTFYRSSSPDAQPYVTVGDTVKKGQVLCLVEAMKLMNEIESDVDGKVVEVLVQDAQPVQYGQPLFVIEPL